MTSQQYAYAAQIVLFPALALSKIGICLSYLRIFYADQRGRRFIQALIEVAFQCKPIHVYWTELRPANKCVHDQSTLYINGSINVAADFALICIVLPRIWNLQINKRQKGALVGVVLLGFLVLAAGVVRMIRVGTVLRPNTIDIPW